METENKKIKIARLFFEMHKTLKRSMRRCFEDIGMTMPQSFVMGILVKSGEMKLTELSREMKLSNSTVSGIIDRLEKQQLVERTRSEKDKRIVHVKATHKFHELHDEFVDRAEKSFESLLDTATSEDMDIIINGLNVLGKILASSYKE
ncbi:MAG: TrmB family transcriptional regulator [Clostridiales bacterium GWC2_40_7]|nr:MAG: TrmB family transcriptional regulator [Clostridiales bacterium GWC2_40_7]